MEWEFDVLYGLQGLHGPVLDVVMAFLSSLGNAGVFWIVLSCLFCIPKSTRKTGIEMLVTMAVAFLMANVILKPLVHRDRPCWIDTKVPLLIKSPSDYSFPSGHSVNGFAAATALLCNHRKFGIPAVLLASVIAFSRLYLFVHFPTDVFAGIAIGVICALPVHRIMSRIPHKCRD